MNSALVFMTSNSSYLVINKIKCKTKGYKWMKKQVGDFAIFVGWL